MALAESSIQNTASDDELDEILNSIGRNDAVLNEKSQQESRNPAKKDNTLGIDEEVKIVKQRRPVPKLNDELLLSAAGIPKLRRISKQRLRFKGKGHEYGDIARMLNMYQLWLDDLYPRAKFADGLTMIEKLGHTKRIQYMRKEWIDEAKPKHEKEDDSEGETGEVLTNALADDTQTIEEEPFAASSGKDGPPRQAESNFTHSSEQRNGYQEPDEDELDALLAETENLAQPTTSIQLSHRPAPADDDMFADDMEAMEGMW